jgi:proton-dependent oligopeptide transporter, POT family
MMSATAATVRPADRADEFFGHPKGVYVCFFTEMWERFSFYGMKALLFLYLTKYHLFGDDASYNILGAYAGLVYAIPVIGGALADRYLGMRKAVIFGAVLLCLGHLGMAVEGHAATAVGGAVVRDERALTVFYTSLALIIMGVGFLKPNISTIVGKLYAQDDPRRDSGFSLFYAGINLGALFASLVCGYLGETLGWRYGFGAAGIGMVLGLVMFVWGRKYLHGLAEPPAPERLRERTAIGLKREPAIYLFSVLGLAPIAWLMWSAANGAFSLPYDVPLAMALMLAVLLVVLIWFMIFILTKCTPVERDRMIAAMVIIFWTLVFFTLYEQTYGSWVAFTDRLLTKDMFPALVQAEFTMTWGTSALQNVMIFLQHAPWSTYSLLLAPVSFFVAANLSDRDPNSIAPKAIFGLVLAVMLVFLIRDVVVLRQTAGSLTYLGAMFIVLLAPIFTVLWGLLDRVHANPSKSIKVTLGLAFAGLAFVPLALAAEQVGATGQMASVWWLVLAYFVLELGEMCLSPVGLSAVTQLSVPRVVSLMMGTWFLATAFSEGLAALLAKRASIEVPTGEVLDVVDAAGKYADLFWLLMWIGLGCALVALLLSPLIKRLMHGIR